MEETITYKGHEIPKTLYVVQVEPYKTLDSNPFEMTEGTLVAMLEDLNKKSATLEYEGIEFRNLRYEFDANEDHSDDDYYPHYASCEISFLYDVPENELQSEERINVEKDRIDRTIAAKEMVNKYEIKEAIRLLEEQGYSVSKK